MMNLDHRSDLNVLRAGVSAAVLAFASGGFAAAQSPVPPAATAAAVVQTAPAPGAPGQTGASLEEVVVTGSRVARAGFSAPTPVTVIGSQDIQRRAATNVATVLNDIPSFRATTSPTTTNFTSSGAGLNFADLRGLGTNRTLVLVDGRRYVPSALTGQTDLNQIPTLLIDRIETVTGGASAAYGSDAVAGVVNILLRKRMQGIELTAQYGASEHGDDEEYRIGGAGGFAFAGDRGHVTAGLDYVKNKGVGDIYTRGWGRQEYGVLTNPTPGVNGLPALIISPYDHFSTMAQGGIITSGPLAGTAFGPGGTPYQWNYGQRFGSTQIGGSGAGITNETYQDISPPIDRTAGLVRGDYEVTDAITANAELSYGRTHSVAINGPPRDQANLTIQPDNAFIPASIQAQRLALGIAKTSFTMGRYEDDVQIIRPDSTISTLRAVFGLNGKLGHGWTWNGYYQYGRSEQDLNVYGNRITANWLSAIDAVVSPSSGQIVCRSTLTNPSNGCVPLNIFGVGSPSAAAKAYVTGTENYNLVYTQQVAAVNVQGTPFSTWAGPVAVASGFEYREDRASATSDAISQASGFQIGNPKPFSGKVDVKEGYVEADAPLAANLPLAKSLDLNGAARVTDYSTSGTVTTWKAGFSWVPVDDVRLRATRSRDIRAPSLSELFAPITTGQTPLTNPYTNTQAFVRSLTGSNPNLKPEVGDTWTGGVVYQPHFVPGLRMAIDYFSIDLQNAVISVTAQNIVNRCFAGILTYCPFVTYDANHNLTQVQVLSLNASALKTSGVDWELAYRMPLSNISAALPGAVSARVLGTYVDHLTTVDAGGTVDRAGAITGGVPKWIVNTTLTYSSGPLEVTGQVRYIGAARYDNTMVGPGQSGYSPFLSNSISNNFVGAVTYVNAGVSYEFQSGGARPVRAFFNVNNLFDRDPPPVPAQSGSNPTSTTFYDVIGRQFSAGVRMKF